MFKHGGARIGAGKKKTFINPVNINSRLEKTELDLIETKGIGKTKSEKLRYIIQLGLETLKAKNNN
ncbi:MAG: hypothetical protein ACRCYT_06485 [Cetobacterium sp.]